MFESLNIQSLFTYTPSTGRITNNPRNVPANSQIYTVGENESGGVPTSKSIGFNSKTFNRPFGINPLYATEKNS